MRQLTDRRQEVLDAIVKSIETHGYAPSIRELAEQLGFSSTNAVSDHLRRLVRDGYIAVDRGKARAIRVLRRSTSMENVEGDRSCHQGSGM